MQESFSDTQPWVHLPPRSKLSQKPRRALLILIIVQFLDESSDIRSQYTEDADFSFSHDNSPQAGSSKSGKSPDCIAALPFPAVTPTDGFTVSSLLNSESPVQSQSHGDPRRSQDDHTALAGFQQAESSTFVYQQPPGQPILWPLEHEQEAMLLQHYIENVALFVSVECLTLALPIHR